VASVTITGGGSGYTSAPTIGFSGGGGSGATATAALSSAVAGLSITAGGSGYTSAPTIGFSGGNGSGAAATANLTATSVAGLTVTNAGSGYTSAPTIALSGGAGSGAATTANLTPTTIAGLTKTAGGAGYTSAPTVSFSGGGGSGAAATTTITASIETITWDLENRPAAITGGTSFVYDGDSNRVEETSGGQTTLYINKYYEKNLATGVVTTYYYLGGTLVAQNTGSTLKYISQDNLGSTSTMTTATGTLDSTISYFPFGTARAGSVNSEKQFTGQILDSTGLYYYNARYYDPTIGRFISADSVVQSISNPQTLNRYSYCANNPLNSIDPTGNFSWKTALKIAAIVAIAVVVVAAVVIAAPIVLPALAAAATAIAASATTAITAVTAAAITATAVAEEAPAIEEATTEVEPFVSNVISDIGSGMASIEEESSISSGVNAENGFDSFGELKQSLGDPGEGNQWHHVVEQCQIQKSGFDSAMIQNPDNIVTVNAVDHAQISGYYNSIDPGLSESLRVRDWLAGQSFDFQYNFGQGILDEYGY
jgi:RHS repeat-associated protein